MIKLFQWHSAAIYALLIYILFHQTLFLSLLLLISLHFPMFLSKPIFIYLLALNQY